MNVNKTAIETDSFGPVEVLAMHYWARRRNAPSGISRSARKPCRWRSRGHFELNVYRPIIALAFLESLALLADAVDSFRRHCVERLAANRKRIDELMRQSLMLVTALAPRIGYDNAARIAKATHLNGTSLREEALASGLVSAGEFDALVRPEAMLAPYD
jgi:fumarate hydratase class II